MSGWPVFLRGQPLGALRGEQIEEDVALSAPPAALTGSGPPNNADILSPVPPSVCTPRSRRRPGLHAQPIPNGGLFNDIPRDFSR